MDGCQRKKTSTWNKIVSDRTRRQHYLRPSPDPALPGRPQLYHLSIQSCPRLTTAPWPPSYMRTVPRMLSLTAITRPVGRQVAPSLPAVHLPSLPTTTTTPQPCPTSSDLTGRIPGVAQGRSHARSCKMGTHSREVGSGHLCSFPIQKVPVWDDKIDTSHFFTKSNSIKARRVCKREMRQRKSKLQTALTSIRPTGRLRQCRGIARS